MIRKGVYTFVTLLFLVNFVSAQCPISNFNIPDTVCIGETINFENLSVNASKYEWDFCVGDMTNDPAFSLLMTNNLLNSFYYSIIKVEDVWYGFASRSSDNGVLRLNFGNSLNNTPTITNLGNIGNKLNGPTDIKIVEIDGSWYGLIANQTSSELLLVSFGEDINTIQSVKPIEGITGLIEPSTLSIHVNENNIHVLITNGNDAEGSVVQLLFDGNFETVVQEKIFSIPNSQRIRGLSILRDCDTFKGIVSSYSNNKLYKLDFINGLNNDPIIEEIIVSGLTFKSPAMNMLVREGEAYYGFIQSRVGNLYRLNFGSTLSTIDSGVDLGRIDASSPNAFAFTMVEDNSHWFGFSLDFSKKRLNRIDFINNCATVQGISTQEIPSNINYEISGDYLISLHASNENGDVNSITKAINVRNVSSPQIDFAITSTFCTAQINTFSGSSLNEINDITLWNWNFGDGNTATGQEVTHQYTTPGTYTVTLEIESANGCGNRITKEITIYEPPVPKFTVPEGLICTGGAVPFTNLTNTQGADDIISYHWDFNGEGMSTEANPSFEFLTGGTKTVTLTASIPGCSEVYDTAFFVYQGPKVAFSAPYICQGSEMQLENLTTGDAITRYHWDFGDGGTYTSTSGEAPFYTYDSAGTFTVTLTVDNAAGCTNVLSKTVTVYQQPQVSFLAEVACAGIPVTFTDLTTAGTSANVIAWEWDFGDGQGTSNVRHPEYTYQQPGTYLVELTTQTSAGCSGSYQQEIVVESPVITNFTHQALCSAEEAPYTFLFQDASTIGVGDQIQSWLWTINGENFTTQAVEYVFATPGTYTVSLTAFARSACNATVTRTIDVLPVPEVAFSYTSACEGAPFVFTNETKSEEGVIQRYTWDFGGVGTSFETHPQFTFTEPGTYTVRLTAETSTSCTYTVEQQVEIFPLPKAQFTPSVTQGGTPLKVQFTQQSTGVHQYRWAVNDTLFLTEEHPVYTFQDTGTYNITLTVENESGCTSQLSRVITVLEPVWDVALENVRILPKEQEGYQILLTIRNTGTVPVTAVPVSLTIDQLLELRETFQGYLAPGEKTNFPVSVTLSNQVNQQVTVNYICATLLNGDERWVDPHPADNRNCTSMADTFFSIIPYPNPVKDVLEVSLLLPQSYPVRMVLENTDGKQVQSFAFSETQAGLNTFTLPITALSQGQYLLQIYYAAVKKTYRLLVHP